MIDDQLTYLEASFTLTFAVFATANHANNSNLAILDKTPYLSATTSISNEFLTTLATFANTTLERKSNLYESYLFLFAANHQ